MTKKSNKESSKLPPASDWKARDIDDWNTTTFHAYMSDLHKDLFGCDYVPFRGWQVEKGLIGNAIGTRTKKGAYSKTLIKRFIDETFNEYKPTRQYPGTNFGFMYAYRKNVLQRLQAEEYEEERREESRNNSPSLDELEAWL